MIHPARYHSLGELLDDALHQFASATACIEAERDRENVRLEYHSFRERSRRVSAWLLRHNLHDGARVGILGDNQAAWLLAAAGALHVGATLVPLDRRLTTAEQQALLRHARVDALCADPHVLAALGPQVTPTLSFGRHPGADNLHELPAAETIPLHTRQRDDVACVVYSSGTGGEPKGCLLTHGNYLAQYGSLMETFEWRAGDRYLSILPTNHAIDFMCGFVAAFATGATVIHQRTLRPELITATMRRYAITQMSVVPLILRAFEERVRERIEALPKVQRQALEALLTVNDALTQRRPNHALSRLLLKPIHEQFGGALRMIFCGGAFTERGRAELFHRIGIPVAIGYGLTEACTVVTVNDLRPFRGETVGAPVPGVQLRIQRPDAHGIGEVQVRGPTVFRGYLDAPDLTEAAFEDGWLRTGDLGWLDGAHHLRLVGRSRNMIVTPGGKNVYPEDIEAAFDAVPCEELAVMAEDYVWPRSGLVGERLVVALRPKDGRDWREALVRANLALPDFKRVSGVIVWTESFPRTASMKIKRAELALALRQGADRSGLVEVST